MDLFSYLLGHLSGSGSGTAPEKYKSIKYIDKNTVILIDNKDKKHTIRCSYDNENKINSISMDNIDVPLEYKQQVLYKIGQIVVDLKNA